MLSDLLSIGNETANEISFGQSYNSKIILGFLMTNFYAKLMGFGQLSIYGRINVWLRDIRMVGVHHAGCSNCTLLIPNDFPNLIIFLCNL